MAAPINAKAYKLPLRSKLIDWIDSLPQKTAQSQQWHGMLNNVQNIRKEEIERAVILDIFSFFDAGEQLAKQELSDAMNNSLAACRPILYTFSNKAFRPTLDVKTIIDQLPKHVEQKARRFVDKALNCYQHPSIGYWIIRTGYEDLATVAPNWIVLDHKGKMLRSHERHGGWFPSAIEAFDEMHRSIRKRFDEYGSERPSTLYDQYALMGGTNYQEWFICLPDWPLPYRDGHFNLKQLLVHIRTTERIDHDGQPLFMVEEIQSPWHADIHKHGSTTDEDEIGQNKLVADAPFAKEWHELAIKFVIWLAIKQGFTQVGFTTGQQQCNRWGKLEGLMNLYEQRIPMTLKKIAAQFDCTNDWATIVSRKPAGRLYRIRTGEWVVQGTNKIPISPPVKNKDVALHYLSSRSPQVKEQIRLLHISSGLKEAVISGGVPLFGW